MTTRFSESAVAGLLAMIAAKYPRSLAARIKPECFESVVKLTTETLCYGASNDFEALVIASLGRLREQEPALFRKRKQNPFMGDKYFDFHGDYR